MNNPFELAQGTINDIEPLTVLFNEYRIFYKQQSDAIGARAFLHSRIENNESVIFLVRDKEQNRVIGFTQLYPSFSSISMKRSWILNDLYVTEAYRGRGAAQLLLDAARTYAEQTGAKGLALSTAMDNQVAQALYERNGYEKDEAFYSFYLTL